MILIRLIIAATTLGICGSVAAGEPGSTNSPANSNTNRTTTVVTAEINKTTARVRQIVNQPVPGVFRTESLKAAHYPVWFHPGAGVPDYETVDIRRSQETPYDQFPYICSDQKPNTAYVGRMCEFNANTKIFYTDRTVPKKKLTDAEMLEINRLYRIIGRDLKELEVLPPAIPAKP